MIKFRLFSVDFSVSFWTVIIEVYAVSSCIQGQTIILISLFCTIVHEAGHLLMMALYCGKPDRIVIGLFEIKICTDLNNISLHQDIIITSFGVISNVFLSLLSYLICIITNQEIFMKISVISLVIGFLNILPVESFDGGQLLRIFLGRFLSQKSTDIIMIIISLFFLIPLVLLGVTILFTSKNNYSLLFIAIYIILFYYKRNCGDSVV